MKFENEGQFLGMSVFVGKEESDDAVVGGCAPTFSVVSKIKWKDNPEKKWVQNTRARKEWREGRGR